MSSHQLKIQSKYFNDVVSGLKTFEIRKNDRNFKVGDILNLEEIQEDGGGWFYTGENHHVKVTYITEYAQENGYVVLGIQPYEEGK